jgi:hypothetical protein
MLEFSFFLQKNLVRIDIGCIGEVYITWRQHSFTLSHHKRAFIILDFGCIPASFLASAICRYTWLMPLGLGFGVHERMWLQKMSDVQLRYVDLTYHSIYISNN